MQKHKSELNTFRSTHVQSPKSNHTTNVISLSYYNILCSQHMFLQARQYMQH